MYYLNVPIVLRKISISLLVFLLLSTPVRELFDVFEVFRHQFEGGNAFRVVEGAEGAAQVLRQNLWVNVLPEDV